MFFESLENSSYSSRKQIFRDIFNRKIFLSEKQYVYSLELPLQGGSNVYTQHTLI